MLDRFSLSSTETIKEKKEEEHCYIWLPQVSTTDNFRVGKLVGASMSKTENIICKPEKAVSQVSYQKSQTNMCIPFHQMNRQRHSSEDGPLESTCMKLVAKMQNAAKVQRCYKDAAKMLQGCCKDATRMLQRRAMKLPPPSLQQPLTQEQTNCNKLQQIDK
jgi:hypothetical protein